MNGQTKAKERYVLSRPLRVEELFPILRQIGINFDSTMVEQAIKALDEKRTEEAENQKSPRYYE